MSLFPSMVNVCAVIQDAMASGLKVNLNNFAILGVSVRNITDTPTLVVTIQSSSVYNELWFTQVVELHPECIKLKTRIADSRSTQSIIDMGTITFLKEVKTYEKVRLTDLFK